MCRRDRHNQQEDTHAKRWSRPHRAYDAGGRRSFQITAAGFRDAVVWNPWTELAASIPDMKDEEYERMLCVEASQVEVPVTLAPGTAWQGEQKLRCVRAGS